MEKLPFTALGLSPELLKAVDKMGFEEASPIQTAVIPVILSGRDAVGQSSTGSGKTAAFALPAIEKVDLKVRGVQVLILCPTRELAVQVAEEVGKLAFFKRGVEAVPVYGGQSYDRQYRAFATGAQIIIGTPGRILDHLERGSLKLDKLKFLVLDEVDRMLDMGFIEDIEKVVAAAPDNRQLLFFSATVPRPIQELIKRFSKDPAWIQIENHAQNSPQVDQVYFEVDRRSKIEVLTRLIDLHDFRYGIVFCSTKIMVDELNDQLHSRGYAADRLHGDISQDQRNRTMEKFRRRGFEFLIATDVAARGLDVDDLEVVFNFDLPNDAEDYTHRIGRTGRAGRSGRAFTFVSGRELWKLEGMVRYARLQIRRERVPSLDQVEAARENVFFEKLRATLISADFKSQDRMIDRLLEQGYASTDIISALVHLLQGGAVGDAEVAARKAKTDPTSPVTASTASSVKSTVTSAAKPAGTTTPKPVAVEAAKKVESVEVAKTAEPKVYQPQVVTPKAVAQPKPPAPVAKPSPVHSPKPAPDKVSPIKAAPEKIAAAPVKAQEPAKKPVIPHKPVATTPATALPETEAPAALTTPAPTTPFTPHVTVLSPKELEDTAIIHAAHLEVTSVLLPLTPEEIEAQREAKRLRKIAKKLRQKLEKEAAAAAAGKPAPVTPPTTVYEG
ncbi:MAG: DEAD/DEAH box helicase [Verrucomicrobiota bacterium]|nr:DEAD/DEAH box helicase [Verrucomicrobiota bacterium]